MTDYLVLTEFVPGTKAKAEEVNANFTTVKDAVNTKASAEGDSTKTFDVATATSSTHAVTKAQLDSTSTSINEALSETNGKIPTISTANMSTLANNSTDSNNDIDFSAGFCWDSALTVKITNTAMTKRLDASWVSGTNQGGLDTGNKAVSTYYHCFAIAKTDGTSDFLFSTSATTPTMPSGYTYKRRIGSIRTDASGNIMGFVQVKDNFYYKTPFLDVSVTNLGTSATIYTIGAPAYTTAIINSRISHASGGQFVYVSSPSVDDLAPSSTVSPLSNIYSPSSGVSGFAQLYVYVGVNCQIRARSTATNTTFYNATVGWIDKRGVN